MKLYLDRVKQTKGNTDYFELQENIENIKVKDETSKFLGPISVTGQVENLGKRILQVSGIINVTIESLCYRCLSKAVLKLDLVFSLKLSDIVTESTENDEDIIAFSGDEIELRPYVINEILLNWPAQVLCSPDCKGLCPICGTNLNVSSCDCKDEHVDPRLSVLKNLLKQS